MARRSNPFISGDLPSRKPTPDVPRARQSDSVSNSLLQAIIAANTKAPLGSIDLEAALARNKDDKSILESLGEKAKEVGVGALSVVGDVLDEGAQAARSFVLGAANVGLGAVNGVLDTVSDKQVDYYDANGDGKIGGWADIAPILVAPAIANAATGDEVKGMGTMVPWLRMTDDDSLLGTIVKGAGAFGLDTVADPLNFAAGSGVIGKSATSAGIRLGVKEAGEKALAKYGDDALRNIIKVGSERGSTGTRLADLATEGADDAVKVAAKEFEDELAGLSRDELLVRASDALGTQARMGFETGGHKGSRLALQDMLGETDGRQLFDMLPGDLKGGLKLTAPFSTKTMALTPGGGIIAENLGIAGKPLEALTDLKLATRAKAAASKPGQALLSNLAGRNGAARAGIARALATGDNDVLRATVETLNVFEDSRPIINSVLGDLAQQGRVVQASIQTAEKEAKKAGQRDAFRRHLARFYFEPSTEAADGLESQAKRLAADLRQHEIDTMTRLKEVAPDALPDELDDYRRIVAQPYIEAKQKIQPTARRAGETNMSRARTSGVRELDKDGNLSWYRPDEINADKGIPFLEVDPLVLHGETVNNLIDRAMSGVVESQLRSRGLIVPGPTTTVNAVNQPETLRLATEMKQRLVKDAGEARRTAAGITDQVQARVSEEYDREVARQSESMARRTDRITAAEEQASKLTRSADDARSAHDAAQERAAQSVESAGNRLQAAKEKASTATDSAQKKLDAAHNSRSSKVTAARESLGQAKEAKVRIETELKGLERLALTTDKEIARAEKALASAQKAEKVAADRLADARAATYESKELRKAKVSGLLEDKKAAVAERSAAERAHKSAVRNRDSLPKSIESTRSVLEKQAAKVDGLTTRLDEITAAELARIESAKSALKATVEKHTGLVAEAERQVAKAGKRAERDITKAARSADAVSWKAIKAKKTLDDLISDPGPEFRTQELFDAKTAIPEEARRFQELAKSKGKKARQIAAVLDEFNASNSPEEGKAIASRLHGLLTAANERDFQEVLQTFPGRAQATKDAQSAYKQLADDLANKGLVSSVGYEAGTEQIRSALGYETIGSGLGNAARVPSVLQDSLTSPMVREIVEQTFQIKNAKKVSKFGEGVWKPYMALWRTFATVGRGPAFVWRNITGGVANAWYLDVGVRDFNTGVKYVKGVERAVRDTQKALKAGEYGEESVVNLFDNNLRKHLGDEMYQHHLEMEKRGIFGGALGTIISDNKSAITPDTALGRARDPLASTLQLDQLSPLNQKVIRGADVMMNIAPVRAIGTMQGAAEMWLRSSTYFAGLRKYGTGDSGHGLAALGVKATQFDYTDLSDFERNVMRNVLPFYQWTRNNIPLQLRAVLNQPGKVNMMLRANETAQSMFGRNDGLDEYLPEWIRDQNGWLSQMGAPTSPMAWGMNLPINDLNRFLPSPDTISNPVDFVSNVVGAGESNTLSSLNPVAKSVMEILTGTSTFTGQKYGDQEASGLFAALPFMDSYRDPETGKTMASGQTMAQMRNLVPGLGSLERYLPVGQTESGKQRLAFNIGQQLGGAALPVGPIAVVTPTQLTGETDRRNKALEAQIKRAAGNAGLDPQFLRDATDAGYTPKEIADMIRSGRGKTGDKLLTVKNFRSVLNGPSASQTLIDRLTESRTQLD